MGKEGKSAEHIAVKFPGHKIIVENICRQPGNIQKDTDYIDLNAPAQISPADRPDRIIDQYQPRYPQYDVGIFKHLIHILDPEHLKHYAYHRIHQCQK